MTLKLPAAHKNGIVQKRNEEREVHWWMSGEEPDELLVVQVPHGDVAVRAAAEADLRVGTQCERVARRRRRLQLGLDARTLQRVGFVKN